MKPATRAEILDLQRYEAHRDELRREILQIKAARRIHLGDCLTFLFENADTVRYQVQEMCRAERIWKDADVARELRTYNALLGGEGELGCTLLIELDDAAERAVKLRAWQPLPERLYVRMADDRLVRATFDESQRDAERLSAVQFLKFAVGGDVPVALGTDFDALKGEVVLTAAQRAALAADLAS